MQLIHIPTLIRFDKYLIGYIQNNNNIMLGGVQIYLRTSPPAGVSTADQPV